METYLQNYLANVNERDKYGTGTDGWNLYNGQAMSSVLGGGLSLVNGATNLIGMSKQLSTLRDTDKYDYQLNQMAQFRDGKTWDINQLIEQQQSMPTFLASAEDFGPSDSEVKKGAWSSALSGATTGGSVFGLPGAIVGGLIGGITGLVSGKSGQAKAERLADAKNSLQKRQNELNGIYFRGQADKINDFNYGNMWATRMDNGGEIERRQQSLQEFADAVLRKQKVSPDRSSGIMRQHCKGGTMIRIKR